MRNHIIFHFQHFNQVTFFYRLYRFLSKILSEMTLNSSERVKIILCVLTDCSLNIFQLVYEQLIRNLITHVILLIFLLS